MKKFILLMLSSALSFTALAQSCPDNIMANGDFEIGTPAPSDNHIQNADQWSGIWDSGSKGDYGYSMNSKSGGFWVSNYISTDPLYREGIMNKLVHPIYPGCPDYYELKFDYECIYGSGDVEMGIYGVYNPSNTESSVTIVNNTTPLNVNLFPPNPVVLLGTLSISAACGETTNHATINFFSNVLPSQGITHIFLTRSETINGNKRYIAVDNFCLRPKSLLTVTGQTNVCYSSTLSASAGYSNYIWRDQNGTQIGTGQQISVTSSGTYTVSAISQNGCLHEASININIYISPKITLPSEVSVCNEHFQQICGPSNTSVYNFTYKWYYNDPTPPFPSSYLVSNNQCYTPTQYGSYTLIVTNQYGCSSNHTINVVEGFGPNIYIKSVKYCDKQPISVGFPVSYSDALSYDWTYDNGNGPQVVPGGYQVPYQGDGQYCVTVNWGNSKDSPLLGCTSQTCFTVGRFCDPTISYCVQDCIFNFTLNDLAVPTGANVTYYWDFGNGQTSTVMNPSVYFQNNGLNTATVTITINDGFNVTVVTKTITVYNNCPTENCDVNAHYTFQQVGINPYYGPRHYQFNNLSSYGPAGSTISYEWVITRNNLPYGTYTTAGLDIYLPGGNYTICLIVSVTNPNGFVCKESYCRSIIVPTKKKVTEVPGDLGGLGGLKIHPNPSSGRFNLTIITDVEVQTPVTLIVTNMQGKDVYKSTEKAGKQFLIDISNEPNGTYTVSVEYDNELLSEKIVLQR